MNLRIKFDYVRSPKLLRACRSISCQNCGVSDGSVVAAHSNQAIHGKGKSVKSSDIYVASLCHVCHHAIDQGRSMSRTERVKVWTDAHVRTVKALVERGLWPVGLEVPQ